MKEKMNNVRSVIWICIIAIFTFIHIYKINVIPYGLNVDEVGMGYDAWCLSHYGVDRYLNSFPIYMINYSGGQSALYAYLCAPFVYTMGINAVSLRIPIILFAFLTFFCILKLTSLIWKDELLTLLAAIVVTVSPVFCMLFRIGLDCNLMLGMSTLVWLVFEYASQKRQIKYYILSGICCGLLLYSYALSHLLLPIVLFVYLLYLLYVRRITIKEIVVMAIPLGILGFPLILFHIINLFGLSEMKLGIFTIPKLYRYRGNEIDGKLIKDNFLLFFKYSLCNDYVRFNSTGRFYNMYLISIPFIILGFFRMCVCTVWSLKERIYDSRVLLLIWGIASFLIGILLDSGGPTIYRINSVFGIYVFYLTEAMFGIKNSQYSWLQGIRGIFIYAFGAIYIVMGGLFFKYYFTQYTEDTYLIDLFNFKFDDVIDYIEQLPDGVSKRDTYIGDGNQTYAYYLCGEELSPYEYNELKDDQPYTLWQWTQDYKNYHFYFPEEINPVGSYIVPETSKQYITQFRQYGFKEAHIGTHILFWNAFLTEDIKNVEYLSSWDHGIENQQVKIEDSTETILSGWSLNVSLGIAWDDIIVRVGNQYYIAEKFEREDVAQIMGNDLIRNCGVRVQLDSEQLKQNDIIIVYYINYLEQSYSSEKIQIMK